MKIKQDPKNFYLREYDRATLGFIEAFTLHHSHNLLSEPLHCPLQHRINKTISLRETKEISLISFS